MKLQFSIVLGSTLKDNELDVISGIKRFLSSEYRGDVYLKSIFLLDFKIVIETTHENSLDEFKILSDIKQHIANEYGDKVFIKMIYSDKQKELRKKW